MKNINSIIFLLLLTQLAVSCGNNPHLIEEDQNGEVRGTTPIGGATDGGTTDGGTTDGGTTDGGTTDGGTTDGGTTDGGTTDGGTTDGGTTDGGTTDGGTTDGGDNDGKCENPTGMVFTIKATGIREYNMALKTELRQKAPFVPSGNRQHILFNTQKNFDLFLSPLMAVKNAQVYTSFKMPKELFEKKFIVKGMVLEADMMLYDYSEHTRNQMLCALNYKVCSGKLHTDRPWVDQINENFWTNTQNPINDRFTEIIFKDYKPIPTLSNSQKVSFMNTNLDLMALWELSDQETRKGLAGNGKLEMIITDDIRYTKMPKLKLSVDVCN